MKDRINRLRLLDNDTLLYYYEISVQTFDKCHPKYCYWNLVELKQEIKDRLERLTGLLD